MYTKKKIQNLIIDTYICIPKKIQNLIIDTYIYICIQKKKIQNFKIALAVCVF